MRNQRGNNRAGVAYCYLPRAARSFAYPALTSCRNELISEGDSVSVPLEEAARFVFVEVVEPMAGGSAEVRFDSGMAVSRLSWGVGFGQREREV